MPFDFNHDTIILDASSLISLYATQRFESILRAIPAAVTVAAYVYQKEALWIFAEPGTDNNKGREPIILQPLIEAGLLTIVDIESEDEAEMLVNLSARIKGQGEAESGAIAIVRNWAFAADDRKARRLVQDLAPQLQLIYALDLVKNWVDLHAISAAEISRVLENVRQRGSYIPHRGHPHYNWWHAYQGA